MKSIAYQIATYLSDTSVGSFTPDDVTGNIYIDMMSETPNTIAIFNQGGLAQDLTSHKELGIQIYYKGDSNPIQSYDKATEIFDCLQHLKGVIASDGNYIVNCYSPNSSGPTRIGRDENGNFEYSLNFIISFSI